MNAKKEGVTLGERLADARKRALFGRETEQAVFRSMLDGHAGSPSVLWLCGLGGIGKSTLLDLFDAEARASGCEVLRFDARDLRTDPTALDRLLPAVDHRCVVMFDTCEDLGALEQDLFTQHLPAIPAGTLLVFAGRSRPTGRWPLDPGWRSVLKILEVGPLDASSSTRLLASAGMPPALQTRWLAFTRGHPLALALAIEGFHQHADSDADSAEPGPAVVGRLLERFIDSLPSAKHRAALELSAIARVTSEGLLRTALGEGATELFSWLRRLAFMRGTADGLMPHDLVRELVAEDLRWRDPDSFLLRRRQVSRYLIERMQVSGRLAVFVDYLYARRYAVFNTGVVVPEAEPSVYADALRAEDQAVLVRWITDTEGAQSAARLVRWLALQPDAFTIFRGPDGVAGFLGSLHLSGDTWQRPEVDADPILAGIRSLAAARSPTGRPEDGDVLRWWVQQSGLHQPGPVQNLVQARCLLDWGRRSGMRWSFIPNSNAAFWRRHFEGIHFTLDDRFHHDLGGRSYQLFVRDWQQLPFWTWMNQSYVATPDAAQIEAEPAVLDEANLADAVRRALRNFSSDVRLAASPLRTALADGGVDSLRERLRAEVAALATEPRGSVLQRVLEVTFLSGCPSQELAAERLDLPFGTYRHRLRAAEALLIERIAGALRQRRASE